MRSLSRTGDKPLAGQGALVTGGSRGLGLLIARELAAQGCRLLICARDGAELERARHALRETGADVQVFACDLTDPQAVRALAEAAESRLGAVDVLVNNAGIIQVGPIESLVEQDFVHAMDTMFYAPLRLVLALAPRMAQRGGGRVVNISSIGGRIPPPHLLPYSAAKFALAGLSQGLRTELARSGVSVTTVVPGLMRTGSHTAATFCGRSEREYAWFATASSFKPISMDAERAARAIVRAAVRRRPELILTPVAKIAVRVQGIAPATTTRALVLAARLLPGPGGDHLVPGAQAAVKRGRSRVLAALTAPANRASRAFNEPTL